MNFFPFNHLSLGQSLAEVGQRAGQIERSEAGGAVVEQEPSV